MSKRFLRNFLTRRMKVKMPVLRKTKTVLDLWGSEQFEKLESLGQKIVIMQMSA